MDGALDRASHVVNRLAKWLGRKSNATKGPMTGESAALLRWFRDNNRPAIGTTELDRDQAQLTQAIASGRNDKVVLARLAGHAAIIAHRRGAELELGTRNSSEAIHQVDEVMRAGHFPLAKLLLERYASKWPNSNALRVLHVLMDGPGNDDGFDDRGEDFQILPRPGGSATTFVVFTGLRNRFGISLGQLHYAWLSALPVNLIYLRDPASNLYLTGIHSIGNLDTSLQHLSRSLAAMGTEKAVFLGHSGGVFGAIYYGVRLGARTALCFSGTTDLDSLPGSAHESSYQRLRTAHEQGLMPWPDLRQLVGSSALQVRLYYGTANDYDAAQALKLHNLPNVSLYPIEGRRQHFVLDQLAERKELAKIFFDCC